MPRAARAAHKKRRALKRRAAEENSGCSAKGGQRVFFQITAIRSRHRGENCVNIK